MERIKKVCGVLTLAALFAAVGTVAAFQDGDIGFARFIAQEGCFGLLTWALGRFSGVFEKEEK